MAFLPYHIHSVRFALLHDSLKQIRRCAFWRDSRNTPYPLAFIAQEPLEIIAKAYYLFLTADKREIPYTTVASELRMNENALRVAVHRLRKRYRELFREEIAHTLAEGEDVDTELRYLLAVLSA